MVTGDPALSFAQGPQANLDPYEGMTLTEALAARVARAAEARFSSIGDHSVRGESYAALWSRSGRIAAALTALGLPPGSPIALLTDDGLDFIPAFWACLRAGHTAVPLMSAADAFRTRGHASAFTLALTRAAPAAVIADAGFRDVARAELAHCPCLDPEGIETTPPFTDAAAPADTVLLLPTSGTTGQIKLVALSQRALLYRAFTARAPSETSRAHVSVFPLDSTTGMRCALLQRPDWVRLPMSVLVRRPERFLDVLAQFQASDGGLTNTLAEMILAASEGADKTWDLRGLKQVSLGAETVQLSTVRRLDAMLQRFGAPPRSVRAGYGTTETGVLVAGADPLAREEGGHNAAVLGPCAPNVAIRILDEAGLLVPAGRTGNIEVCCDGSFFSGYWDCGRLDTRGFTADGWWRTEDTGFLDDGRLVLQGRTKDILVVNGRKVSLAAIDEALDAALPNRRAYACSVRHDDGPAERLVVAVAGPDPGTLPEPVVRAVREAVGHAFGLAVEAVVQIPTADIPTTATGKISRHALADRLALHGTVPLPGGRTTAAEPVASGQAPARIARLWEAVLGPGSATDPDADFYALGGESMRSLQLFSRLSEAFGVTLDPRAFYRRPTLSGLVALLDEAPAPAGEPEGAPDLWPLTARQHRDLLVFVETWHGRRLTEDRLMVSFNIDGSKPPIFFVCQVEFELRDLAKALGPDQPVHGFRSGHMVAAQQEDAVQAFALRYAADLQAIHPEGPVLLAGTCQGGIIAQAVAEHLLRRERDVPLLTLMDWGFKLRPYPGSVLFLYGQDSHFSSPYRRFHEPSRAWKRRYGAVAAVAVPGAAYRELFDAPHVARTATALAEACASALARSPLQLPAEGRRASVTLASPPTHMAAGQTLTIEVAVSNGSAYAWYETERSGLMLGNYWVDSSGQMLQPTDGRSLLPRIAPGETVTLRLTVRAPHRAGHLSLAVDLVEEGSAWFDPARQHGAAVIPVAVGGPASDDTVEAPPPALESPHLVIDGTVRAGHVSTDELCFSVPASARSVRLVSSIMAAAPPDIRTLGLLITRLTVEAGGSVRNIDIADPALSIGFHELEEQEGRTWRWTNGDAVLVPELWSGLSGDFVLRINGIFPSIS